MSVYQQQKIDQQLYYDIHNKVYLTDDRYDIIRSFVVLLFIKSRIGVLPQLSFISVLYIHDKKVFLYSRTAVAYTVWGQPYQIDVQKFYNT